MKVYRNALSCSGDERPHWHISQGPWHQPPHQRGQVAFSEVDYHDPANGILERVHLVQYEPPFLTRHRRRWKLEWKRLAFGLNPIVREV